MDKNFEQEKEYLKKTLEKFKDVIKYTGLKIESIPQMYSNNPRLLESLLRQYIQKLEILKVTENKPYFARIDFKNNKDGIVDECYIGKVGVSDEDNNLITIDWRAPISSIYYDSNIGVASYEAPEGTIKGELLLKRQYEIENKELISFQDVDTVSNDEILKPYLGVSADNRLKNIVATIQSEQNEIIREKIGNNLIVQGVAGSGKTTVALHRIAYLVYNNIKNIKPEQYLVIGPNKFFVNYISGVLPDLDVNNVSQLTYDEIISDLIEERINILPDEEKIIKSIKNTDKLFYEKLKVSMLYKNAIDNFLKDFDTKVVPDKDFIVKGYNILSKKIIKEVYDEIEKDTVINYEILAKKIDRAILLLSKYIENKSEILLSKIREQFYEKTNNLSSKELDKERKNYNYVEKELRNYCNQSLKKYFLNGKPKILNLYMSYLKNIDKYIGKEEINIKNQVKDNVSNIKNKNVEFEDLGALLYLYYRIYGTRGYENYKHTVIDESQDFGVFNFYALKKLMPNSSFSIFGDLAQSIYQYRGINNWEEIINSTFNGDCDIKYLKKSYRTTTEIMNEANKITAHIGFKTAEPVIRHGIEVGYFEETKENILNIIKLYIDKGYSSIAIISKDKEETNKVNEFLSKNGVNATNITDSTIEYNGGICTITSYLAKGLEFDGVIITNASENIFNSKSNIDMKLLYVSMTRPLHELNILYNGDLSNVLKKQLKNK